MNTTKKICYLAVLTALYVVLSAFLKFTLIGNIQVDLGYIAFAFALCEFSVYGVFVGVIGCSLESVLFSAYGFSISWAVANAFIGLGCGIFFSMSKKVWFRSAITILFVAMGVLCAKTIIECSLYSIPYSVKIPKNAVAFAADSVVMIMGVILHKSIKNKRMVMF